MKFNSYVSYLFFITFFLNLFWEVLHSSLYNWNIFPLENNVYFYIQKILMASLGDAIFLSLIFLIVSAINKNTKWIKFPKQRDYSYIILLGLIFAILIELRAKFFNLWTYNQYMPTLFGIGISPLIQLATTGILSLIILKKFLRVKY